jgi:hypothetical protein
VAICRGTDGRARIRGVAGVAGVAGVGGCIVINVEEHRGENGGPYGDPAEARAAPE